MSVFRDRKGKLKRMNVGDICNRNVIYADIDTDILAAAQLMRKYHVGSIVIVMDKSHDKKPIGIVTDRDLAIKILAKDASAQNITLHDTMTRDLVCVREDDDIMDTTRIMRLEGVRRVPVINDEGGLTGMLTMDDLIEMLATELSNLAGLIGREQRQEKKLECSH